MDAEKQGVIHEILLCNFRCRSIDEEPMEIGEDDLYWDDGDALSDNEDEDDNQ